MSSRSLHGHTRELTVVFSDASAPGAGVHVPIDDVEQVSICRWSESEAAVLLFESCWECGDV